MAGDNGDKTEKPTPRRLQEARKRGQIPRSPDLVSWVVVLVATFVVPTLVSHLRHLLEGYFTEMLTAVRAGEPDAMMGRARTVAASLFLVFSPFLALVMVVTAAGLAVQGGVTFTTEALRPKLERISIRSGFKRLFSAQSLVETAKAVVRLVVLSVLVSIVAGDFITGYLTGPRRDLGSAGTEFAATLVSLIQVVAFVGLIIGLGDYAFQRRKIGKQLKMTKQEVKQEAKTSEGDPMIRSRRRQLHAKLTRNQMLAAVNDASVVVVNPTHVAVALAYEPGSIPKVVAKGGDELAHRIRERAFERGIPVVEARPLARILHDSLRVGAEVPADLYEAVAIVIAFVLRLPKTAVNRTVRSVHVPRAKLNGRDAGGGPPSA